MSEFFRFEYNLITKELTRIDQTVYSNADDHIIILDSTDSVPEGYSIYEGEIPVEDESL